MLIYQYFLEINRQRKNSNSETDGIQEPERQTLQTKRADFSDIARSRKLTEAWGRADGAGAASELENDQS